MGAEKRNRPRCAFNLILISANKTLRLCVTSPFPGEQGAPMIIARRTLTLRQQGQDHPVEVTLAAPRFETGCWLCSYEIHWPSGPHRFYGAGAD